MKGGGDFFCYGRTVGRTIMEVFLRFGWTISVEKEYNFIPGNNLYIKIQNGSNLVGSINWFYIHYVQKS